MRKPAGFQPWKVPVGVLFVREEEDGRWVILAGDPEVKLDNKHMDWRPHMHLGGWNSEVRHPLRVTLTAQEAAAAVRRHLVIQGYIDLKQLQEESLMKVTIQRRRTVAELLSEAKSRYGSLADLQKHVKAHPKDMMAKLALHDVTEYASENPRKIIHETREILIPDPAIDQLTVQRLQLLLTIRGLEEGMPSTRALARAVGRDIKNVSEDIRVLHELGLLEVEEAGPGKANRISLPGDQIDLHLVEAEA